VVNRRAIEKLGVTLATSALAVVIALVIGAGFILLSNDNPVDAYRALINGAFGGRRAVAETLVAATPMILGGLAFAVAARAGLFNIGIEGQLVVGSLAGALVGAADLGLPAIVYVPLAVLAGSLAGGIWGALAGIFKAKSGANEVITTIMLNYLAFRLSTYMLTSAGSWFSLIDTVQQATKKVTPDARLPILLERTRLHAGLLFALAAALVLWYLLFRTTFGYKVRTVGLSAGAAQFAGINWGRTVIIAMFASGFLGGMAGAIEANGLLGRHFDNRAGYGFTAIAVGLVGRNHPLGVIAAGLLFGVLRSGANGMQNEAGTSKELVLILQGLVILSISAIAAIEMRRAARGRVVAAPPPPPLATPEGAPA
jgi:general nucleoside transport system permease protein